MRSFDIYIEKFDWSIRVYVGVHCIDADDIIRYMMRIGCRPQDLDEASVALRRCTYNNGLTYSFLKNGMSVMVIGLTDSAEQFDNSKTHEIMHQAVHICSWLGIDLEGEIPCYLAGEIASKMYPYVYDLLCHNCRDRSVRQNGHKSRCGCNKPS